MAAEGEGGVKQCSERVFSGLGGHTCARKATTTKDGKPVCSLHSDEAKARRQEKRLAASNARSAEWDRERAIRKAERDIISAAIEGNAEALAKAVAEYKEATR